MTHLFRLDFSESIAPLGLCDRPKQIRPDRSWRAKHNGKHRDFLLAIRETARLKSVLTVLDYGTPSEGRPRFLKKLFLFTRAKFAKTLVSVSARDGVRGPQTPGVNTK